MEKFFPKIIINFSKKTTVKILTKKLMLTISIGWCQVDWQQADVHESEHWEPRAQPTLQGPVLPTPDKIYPLDPLKKFATCEKQSAPDILNLIDS